MNRCITNIMQSPCQNTRKTNTNIRFHSRYDGGCDSGSIIWPISSIMWSKMLVKHCQHELFPQSQVCGSYLDLGALKETAFFIWLNLMNLLAACPHVTRDVGCWRWVEIMNVTHTVVVFNSESIHPAEQGNSAAFILNEGSSTKYTKQLQFMTAQCQLVAVF